MAEVTHRRDARHACAAFQCMQMTLEFLDVLAVVLVPGPVHEGLIRRFQQLGCFFGENGGDFCIVIRLYRCRGRCRLGFRNGLLRRNVGDCCRLNRVG